jgi:hypothetical protein
MCVTVNIFAQTNIATGMKLPNLTTEQRDAMFVQTSDHSAGLAIFNTDINCVQYWNGEEWIDLCQGTLSAAVVVPPANCGLIKVHGTYYKGANLTSNHYITIPVTVVKKGNFNIMGTTGNGYNFQASGIFDQLGDYTITLYAMGAPANTGTNTLAFICNNQDFAEDCTVQITILPSVLTYETNCDNISIQGNYQTRINMNNTNKVKIPVYVVTGGRVQFKTDLMNGIRFSVDQDVESGTNDTIIMEAVGSPEKAGQFTYEFTTNGAIKTECSFDVTFTSTLGTYSDPACKCFDIYEENPEAGNGEYWLFDCLDNNAVTPVKTYCDMKNGGYTLVWSYSELTAFKDYGNEDGIVVPGSSYSMFVDVPRNIVTTESETINYRDYRLTQNQIRHLAKNTVNPNFKIRITNDPTNMDDEWALNNYVIISPRNTSENPLETSYEAKGRVPSEGKVYGKQFKLLASGGGSQGGWDEVSGNRDYMGIWSSNTYCTHFNFSNVGSNQSFQIYPLDPNTDASKQKVSFEDMNNMFGWFGETQPNHHFGKCTSSTSLSKPEGSSGEGNTASANDYAFFGPTSKNPQEGFYSSSLSRCPCANLKPHSFNNGEGRYLQWFVK